MLLSDSPPAGHATCWGSVSPPMDPMDVGVAFPLWLPLRTVVNRRDVCSRSCGCTLRAAGNECEHHSSPNGLVFSDHPPPSCLFPVPPGGRPVSGRQGRCSRPHRFRQELQDQRALRQAPAQSPQQGAQEDRGPPGQDVRPEAGGGPAGCGLWSGGVLQGVRGRPGGPISPPPAQSFCAEGGKCRREREREGGLYPQVGQSVQSVPAVGPGNSPSDAQGGAVVEEDE